MGYIHANKEVDKHVILDMQKLLRHRGPDDNGTDLFNIACRVKGVDNCAIAFDRLAIRDLSLSGHQPMHDDTNDIVIAFNGEIYNADDFREELVKKGYFFRGHSDTEVLLYMYKEEGIDGMLKKLDGMYAICIADKQNDCIYLVRDRIGEKPLYYYQKEDFLMFASEYKAFYCHPSFKAELNEDVVDEYFLFRYISNGDTLLKGVKNLTPGSYLKITSTEIKQKIYWTLPDVAPNNLSEGENKEKLNQLLRKSLQRRLISDRKIGLQLSGGVDSSYLAYLAQDFLKEPLQTYSITFKEKDYSEEKYIDNVNKKLGCVPNKYEFNPQMFLQYWKDCTYYFESPMNHEGSLGLIFLNHCAKDNGVSVMLCGEGADETLGGYSYFPRMANRIQYHNIMYEILKSLKDLLRYKALPKIKTKSDTFISYTQYISDRAFKKIRSADKKRIEQVYEKRRKIWRETPGNNIRKCMNYSILTYLEDLLMRADKTSMASAMEVRVPFLMPELVEFECTIPDKYLVKGAARNAMRSTKMLLKSLCADVYGELFAYRGKRGFSMPLLGFMSDPKVIEFIEARVLPGIKTRGVLNYECIANMWESRNKSSNFSYVEKFFTLWCCFSFELWAQMYLDNSPLSIEKSLYV